MSKISLNPIDFHIKPSYDIPGSKSIANRVLLLAAINNNCSNIYNIPTVSEDVALMLNALINLGVKFEAIKSQSISKTAVNYYVIGTNGIFPVKKLSIVCGNSGITLRFLTAILAIIDDDVEYTLIGEERLYERPIIDMIIVLQQLGANITYLGKHGHAPLMIKKYQPNRQINTIYINAAQSSQMLSAMLIILPILFHRYGQKISVTTGHNIVSKPYINMTIKLLKLFNVNIDIKDNEYQFILDQQNIKAPTIINYTIETDLSSASYFFALGAICNKVIINNIPQLSLQGDIKFLTILQDMGVNINYQALSNQIQIMPPTDKLRAIDIDASDTPDIAMTLAIVALFAKGVTNIYGLQSLQYKESNRIEALCDGLLRLGAKITNSNSSIQITPPLTINNNITINSYNDHRIAMSFALVVAKGTSININDYNCINKTFSNYFNLLMLKF